jgi:predicted transcriptional regulator
VRDEAEDAKRHLQTAHGMSPDQYRQDYGLPKAYPMVAPNYSEQRRTLAHSIVLGRKTGEKGKAKRTRKAKSDPSPPTE